MIITTPLFYVNDKPHIGHAYSIIIADIINKFYNSQCECTLISGTDEHGKKIYASSKKFDISLDDFIYKNRLEFENLFNILTDRKGLSKSYKMIFNHTYNNKKHTEGVLYAWNKLFERGYIYKSLYSGWYSISDECFYKEKDIDLENKIAIVSGSKVEYTEQECYFFKIENIRDKIIEIISNNNIIHYSSSKNEIINLLKHGCEDIAITRSDTSHGIKVPNDESHVIYVWMDALLGYLTFAGYFDNANDNHFNNHFEYFHVVGKDILKFHAIQWIAILIAIEGVIPKKIISHGWILNGNLKISKSKGNAINTNDLIDKYSVEGLRYIFAKVFNYNDDVIYTSELFDGIYQYSLVNDISNLYSRITGVMRKRYESYPASKISAKYQRSDIESNILHSLQKAQDKYRDFDIKLAIEITQDACANLNKYISNNQVWTLRGTELDNSIYSILNCLKWIAISFSPVMQNAMNKFLCIVDDNSNHIMGENITSKEIIFHENIRMFENIQSE